MEVRVLSPENLSRAFIFIQVEAKDRLVPDVRPLEEHLQKSLGPSNLKLFLGGLPNDVSTDDLKLAVAAVTSAPNDVELHCGESTTFAVLHYLHADSHKAAHAVLCEEREAILLQTSGSGAITAIARDFPIPAQESRTVLISNLPYRDTTATALEGLLRKEFDSYQPTDIVTRFTKANFSLGLAMLKFKEPKLSHQLVSGLQGHILEGAHQPMNVKWLDLDQERAFEDHMSEINKKRSSSGDKKAALISGINLAEQNVQELLSEFGITSAEVKRDPNGNPFGFAETHFQSDVTDEIASLIRARHPDLCFVPLVEHRAPIKVSPERRKRILEKIKEKGRLVMKAQRFAEKSCLQTRVGNAKLSVNYRIETIEDEFLKWFGEGGMLDKLVARVSGVEQNTRQLGEQLNDETRRLDQELDAVREISDEDFVKAFDTRATRLIQNESTKLEEEMRLVGEKATRNALRVVEQCKLIEESSDSPSGFRLKTETIEIIVRPAINGIEKAIAAQKETIQVIEAVLPTKLDEPALRSFVEEVIGRNIETQIVGDGDDKTNRYRCDLERLPRNLDENPFILYDRSIKPEFARLHECKADKISVDEQVASLTDKTKSLIGEAQSRFQEGLSQVDRQLNKVKDRVADQMQYMEDTVIKLEEKLQNDPIPALRAEHKRSEAEIRKLIDNVFHKHGIHDRELAELTHELHERPTQEELHRLVDKLRGSLSSTLSTGSTAQSFDVDALLSKVTEDLKAELQGRPSREDVLNIIGSKLRDLMDQIKREAEESQNPNMWTLRTSSIPEVVAIGKLQYKVFKSASGPTERIVHNGLSPVSATLPPATASVVTLPGPRGANGKRTALSPATRAGSLKPLLGSNTPHRPATAGR